MGTAQFNPILFDFNGTLFWDSPYHDKTWKVFSKTYASRDISDNDMKFHVHGRTNKDILTFVFQKELSDKEIIKYANIKESMYQELVSSKEGLFDLAPGAEQFLDNLKDKKVPINIATSSELMNVEFYFNHLDLERWFDISQVVYFDGSFVPKPAPDIFLKAARNINQPIENCIVMEDSIAGIKAGLAANAYKVILVDSTNTPINNNELLNAISGKISHFDEMIFFDN